MLVCDFATTLKFVNGVYGRRMTIDLPGADAGALLQLRERHGGYYVVLLDRLDSAVMLERARRNEEHVAELDLGSPLIDERTAAERLRIWRVGAPRS